MIVPSKRFQKRPSSPHLGRIWRFRGGALALLGVAACGQSSGRSSGAPGADGGGTSPDASLPTPGAPDAAGAADGTSPHPGNQDGAPIPDAHVVICDAACGAGLVCSSGVCMPPQDACVSNAQCNDDTYCSGTACVPYGSLPGNVTSDPTCALAIPPGAFAPNVFCDFKPALGDPFAAYTDVQATPIVVNFNPPVGDAGLPSGPPSIVVPFTVPVASSYTEDQGVLRVLRGTDCTTEATLGAGAGDAGVASFLRSSDAVAVADLDGDGVAEIVAVTGTFSVVAFTRKGGVWKTLWPTSVSNPDGLAMNGATLFTAPTAAWAGPSIHDLDNDGKPEVIVEGAVLNGQTGTLRAPAPANYATYSEGIPPVIANMDGGVSAEMTNGAHLWTFDGTLNQWTDVASYSQSTTTPSGWAAVADFNPYDGLRAPEIAVASGGTVAVYTIEHAPFLGMTSISVPGGGGGPPTIADFDGDGLPEIGVAGGNFYTVFDPDCQGTPRPGGKCGTSGTSACDTQVTCLDDAGVSTTCLGAPTACPTYVLWSRKTQDHSSNITGSSVFDFEATGTAQVVYADECFVRVYSGPTGQVQFSQYHSSCTWLENPVVADVDGDYHAELVVMSNTACGAVGVGMTCGGELDEYGVDSTFAGEMCQTGTDCASGVCDTGYCRCTTSANCCSLGTDPACIEAGLQCAPPPPGTPGTGNTCRAPHPHGLQGIRVFKDAQNRWVRSRSIWNQHAYAVTNVDERGTVPKTSAWTENWTTTGLNDFRQNVPGTPNGKAVGDITAQAGPNFTCSGATALLNAPVCNRGAAPIAAGVVVGFYVGTTKVCSAKTSTALPVGSCEVVPCSWSSPPSTSATAVNVTVVANDGAGVPVCYANDKGLVEDVFCAPPAAPQ